MGEILEELVLLTEPIHNTINVLKGANIISVDIDEAEEIGTAEVEDPNGDTFTINWNKEKRVWE